MEAITVIIVSLTVISLIIWRMSQRYRGPGEEPDSRNVREYGQPVRSLYTTSAIFTVHHRIEITDENNFVVYRAETKFPSMHDKTNIYRSDGRHVAYIERKLISLHEVRYVEMENGREFKLSNEIFHIIRDVTNIEGLGWTMNGNLMQLNFTITDRDGSLIAIASQKAFSVHDKYSLDIYKAEYEEEAVAILIALQHMVCDRMNAAASSGSGASS